MEEMEAHATDYGACDCFDSRVSVNEVHYAYDVTSHWTASYC